MFTFLYYITTKTVKNDVALIKLNGTATLNQYIRPVCLPTSRTSNLNYGTLVGWGASDYLNSEEKLMKSQPLA